MTWQRHKLDHWQSSKYLAQRCKGAQTQSNLSGFASARHYVTFRFRRGWENITGERGQGLLETALVMPLMILIMVGILDLGRVVFIYTMLGAAAQEGARAGTVTENFTSIEGAVRARIHAVDQGEVFISIDRTEEYAEVEITYTFTPITPMVTALLDGGGIPMRQGARMRLLGVIMDP